MKRLILFALVLGFFTSCVTTNTVVMGTWKSPASASKSYNTIMVAALTNNTIDKSTIETNVSAALNANDVKTLKAIDEFPPNVNSADTNRRAVVNRAREKGADAVLTITLLHNKTVDRYVPGYYGWWGPWWWYPPYDAGYYEKERIYVVENNLYDAQTGKLMWTAQTKTYDPGNVNDFSKVLANILIGQLGNDGIIKVKQKTL